MRARNSPHAHGRLPALPWAWWRDALARRYGVRPWDIDDWPWDETMAALTLMQYDPEAFPGGRGG
jgi:hypothetical protein